MTNGNGKSAEKQKIKIPSYKEINLIFRTAFAVAFFILGFNLSRTAFFLEYPLFGVHLIASTLMSILAALFGFYVFPFLLVQAKYWIESLVNQTVSNIVTDFWEQQSQRLQDARREKQKLKTLEESRKLENDMAQGVLLDTSVLIDGRILDVVRTGFLSGVLIIPQDVINELHLVADNPDKIKRQRGRRGLDVIKDLKRYVKIVTPRMRTGEALVDKALVKFAKEQKLRLMTLDFNLNKVASIAGIKVLNLNELANALKTVFLPGEVITIKIMQEGKEKEQGVGYLADGTMIVVQKAKDKVGEEVTAKVAKIIQSPAGKMIFCDLVEVPEIKEPASN